MKSYFLKCLRALQCFAPSRNKSQESVITCFGVLNFRHSPPKRQQRGLRVWLRLRNPHLFNTQLPLRNPSAPIQNAQINQYIQQLEHSPPIARFNRLNSHQVSTSSPASSSTRLLLRPPLLNVIEASKKEIKMASDEIEQSQSGVEEMGVGGPGAPTPLSALEVCTSSPPMTIVSYCT